MENIAVWHILLPVLYFLSFIVGYKRNQKQSFNSYCKCISWLDYNRLGCKFGVVFFK